MKKKVQKAIYLLLNSALFALETVPIPFLWNVAMGVCRLSLAEIVFRCVL